MAKYPSSQLTTFRLAFCLACCLGLSLANAGERNGTEWKVTSGDTLYQIGRSVYPGDAGKQARLRQDIMMLNPDVFASSALNLQPGVVLQLPRYVVDPQAAAPTPEPPKQAPAPATAVDAARTTWVVARGDTLYSISRSIYPQDSRRQAFLRQDIVKLNRPAFASGTDNLAIGTTLVMPAYVNEAAQANVARAAQPTAAAPVAAVPTTAPVAKPEPVAAPIEPVVAAPSETAKVATAAEPAKSEPVDKRQTTADPVTADTGFLVSLGLAYGGDTLVEVDGGMDIAGGSGINLRLGYQLLPSSGHGYRAALGMQYHPVKDATLTDSYLQLAYQYRATSLLYGIGAVSHFGATVDDIGTSVDFDPATGLFVYLENTGGETLDGWGLSLTSLEIEAKDSGEKFDASSVEIYHRWDF